MEELKESIKRSIEKRLVALEIEEENLNRIYQSRMRTSNDHYYVGSARYQAKKEANEAQKKLDTVIDRKIMLLKELLELEKL